MTKNLYRYYVGYTVVLNDGSSFSGERFSEAPSKAEASSTIKTIIEAENPTAKSVTITRVVEMPWND